jgi:hypothetical protein
MSNFFLRNTSAKLLNQVLGLNNLLISKDGRPLNKVEPKYHALFRFKEGPVLSPHLLIVRGSYQRDTRQVQRSWKSYVDSSKNGQDVSINMINLEG